MLPAWSGQTSVARTNHNVRHVAAFDSSADVEELQSKEIRHLAPRSRQAAEGRPNPPGQGGLHFALCKLTHKAIDVQTAPL
eukprot:scaffold244784_cov35-Tisochrysis_lutea.AAC.2